MDPEESFICTFCWIARCAPSRPKVIGAEARICCQGCWEQILDLAICWVCGEVVVRGDEVVSLGWCFWHRNCFGCLICGKRLRLADSEGEDDQEDWETKRTGDYIGEPLEAGNRLGDEMEHVRSQRVREPKAVELYKVPVCEGCDDMLVETGDYRHEVGLFLGKGNVRQHDGGLSDARWDRLNQSRDGLYDEHPTWTGSRPGGGYVKSVRSKSDSVMIIAHRRTVEQLDHYYFDTFSHSTLERDDNPDCRPQDTLLSDSISYIERPRAPEPPIPIYVSITDPINGPSFRPSPTKPIPRWMNVHPNQKDRFLPLATILSPVTKTGTFMETTEDDFNDSEQMQSGVSEMGEGKERLRRELKGAA